MMTTHADLAVKLLHDAATFFRNVAAQNPELEAQMRDNADVYDQVAQLLAADPLGQLDIGANPVDRPN